MLLNNVWNWILTNIFRIKTETSSKEIQENQKYAVDYQDISDINFNAIFSNKLANYVISDSEIIVTGENARQELMNDTAQKLWKRAKKITSMSFGYGGIVIVPYVKNNKIYHNIVPQDRLTIDAMEGDTITGATILADKITMTIDNAVKHFYRWTNYKIENGDLTITQQYTNEMGQRIVKPDFWDYITDTFTIKNVDRVPFGYIKSPINNRKANDKYGVPITYGCDKTIKEIKELLAQIVREYDLKQAFVGADVSMFGINDKLVEGGLFKKLDTGKDEFFEVYDPAIRDSSYFNRLQELYMRLEHEIGTSRGILSEAQTANATATEIKRAMYDTFTIVDDMRANIEKGLEDFFYACEVLANAFNITPGGTYEIAYNWSYGLIEDSSEEYMQLVQGLAQGVIDKVELRQWLKPTETVEEAQAKIEEIKASNPSIDDLLGTNNEE